MADVTLMPLHDDEVHLDECMVRTLVADQSPEWGHLPVRHLSTDGTVNAIYRIGTEFAARFRLRVADPAGMAADLDREASAMRELGAACPFPTPAAGARSAPGCGYPLPWSVQTWLPGTVPTPRGVAHSAVFAADLSTLVQSFRAWDPAGRVFQGEGRGGDLQDSDEWMELCLRRSEGLLPVVELRRTWARFRRLPRVGHSSRRWAWCGTTACPAPA
jgi:aminoglycoside phosphotransferase (APT) family kinase protein